MGQHGGELDDAAEKVPVDKLVDGICEVEGEHQSQWHQRDQQEVGKDRLEKPAVFGFENAIDNIGETCKKEQGDQQRHGKTYNAQLRTVGDKGIDVVGDDLCLYGKQVLDQKHFQCRIILIKAFHTRQQREDDDKQRNDGGDGVKAQARGIIGQFVIKKLFDKKTGVTVIMVSFDTLNKSHRLL